MFSINKGELKEIYFYVLCFFFILYVFCMFLGFVSFSVG